MQTIRLIFKNLCNDVESTSSKNKKAKSLGVPIISEDAFIEMFGGQNAN